MKFMEWLAELITNHAHYWGVPHLRSKDNRLIQICYECGKDRQVKVKLLKPNEPSHLLYDQLEHNLYGQLQIR